MNSFIKFSSTSKNLSFILLNIILHNSTQAQNQTELGIDRFLKNLPRDALVESQKKVDPEFLISSPNEKPTETPEESASTHGLSLNLSANYPLNSGSAVGSGLGSQGTPAVSPTLQLGIKYNPTSYWFGQITLYRYIFSDRQQIWNPDFTYSFGYDDWHSETFSLVYSNYTGNRFSPNSTKGQKKTVFNQGQWSLGYKYTLPKMLESLLLVNDVDQIGCNANINITPQYTDLRTLSNKYYKKSIALGCRYARPSGWYANATIFAYPIRSQQQPWDPDFSYGFGYFDPRPGTISIQYNNYSANRFPGHNSVPGDGNPRKGSISISWGTQW